MTRKVQKHQIASTRIKPEVLVDDTVTPEAVSVAEKKVEEEATANEPEVYAIEYGRPLQARQASYQHTGSDHRVARLLAQEKTRQLWVHPIEEVVDQEAAIYFVPMSDTLTYKIAASYMHSQVIAEYQAIKKGTKTLEETVPSKFLEFAHIFSKTASDHMLSTKSYDHPIDLEEGQIPPHSKLYPMSPAKQSVMDAWIDE